MNSPKLLSAAHCLAVAISSARAPAQEGRPDAPRAPTISKAAVANADKQAPFVFEAGEVPLRGLIARCGAYLGYNILIQDSEFAAVPQQNQRARRGRGQAPAAAGAAAGDDGDLGPMVEFTLPVVTDPDGCEELLSGILWSHNLSLVAIDAGKKVYEVLSLQGPRGREISLWAVPRTNEEVLARPTLRSHCSTVYVAKNLPSREIWNGLRHMFQGNGSPAQLQVSAPSVGPALMLSGPQHLVAHALVLMQRLDVEVPEAGPTSWQQHLEELTRTQSSLARRIAELEKKLEKAGG